MDTVVAAALAQIVATLAAIAPTHEGLRDYARLNLLPATLLDIRASLEDYDRRVQKLQLAKTALEGLVGDGHPDLRPREIASAALRDLQENLASIAAAREQFVSNEAATLGLTAGTPEPK